jgi:hypothetical protein
MSENEVIPGDTVHVYNHSGEYLGTGVYKGEVLIGDVVTEEDLSEGLEGSDFADAQMMHIQMIGSDEDQYGLECYFDTIGPNMQ